MWPLFFPAKAYDPKSGPYKVALKPEWLLLFFLHDSMSPISIVGNDLIGWLKKSPIIPPFWLEIDLQSSSVWLAIWLNKILANPITNQIMTNNILVIWFVIWLMKIVSNQITNHTHDDRKSNSNQKRGMIGDFFNHPIKSWTTMNILNEHGRYIRTFFKGFWNPNYCSWNLGWHFWYEVISI